MRGTPGDGQALRTSDLYKELERLDGVKKSRTAMLTKPEEIAASVFVTTDDDMRAIFLLDGATEAG